MTEHRDPQDGSGDDRRHDSPPPGEAPPRREGPELRRSRDDQGRREDPASKKEPPRYGRATKTMAFWAVLILLFLVVFQIV